MLITASLSLKACDTWMRNGVAMVVVGSVAVMGPEIAADQMGHCLGTRAL